MARHLCIGSCLTRVAYHGVLQAVRYRCRGCSTDAALAEHVHQPGICACGAGREGQGPVARSHALAPHQGNVHRVQPCPQARDWLRCMSIDAELGKIALCHLQACTGSSVSHFTSVTTSMVTCSTPGVRSMAYQQSYHATPSQISVTGRHTHSASLYDAVAGIC